MRGLVKYLLLMALILAAPDIQARSHYNSARNGFGGLFPHPGMRMQGRYKAIEGEMLIEENASMGTALTIDTTLVHSTAYRYQLRLANLNNKQGKVMSIKNPMTGGKTKVDSPQWGLVFNRDEQGDYCAVVLSCDNSAPYDDITNKRTMQIAVIQYAGHNTRELARTSLARGVSLEDDMNTLCVDVDERVVKVSIGKNELQQVLEVDVKRPAGAVQVGYLVGAGSRVAIERALLSIDNERQVASSTSWTQEALDQYFATSTDPNEGYWHYLDRDMQDDWLRLGGRYTVALVNTGDGYDIIYIDGAQVKKSLWQAGMKKGHLSKTVFTGNYDLMWIDATMEPIDKDAYATIENGVILSLNFPVYKSQMRLAKVIDVEN